MRCFTLCRSCVVLLFLLLLGSWLPADEALRVLPAGKLPADKRLQPLKDLDGYFPFAVPPSEAAWKERAAEVRRRILVSQGLWPMPIATPNNAVIHGKIDRGDFTVERVYFESFPGFYVTGSLYRPVGKTGKLPGVLHPHGHWPQGRFHDAGVKSIREQIVQGAERFEEGGRSPLQARSMQLARMGCVVFHYDMIGYADSQQLSYELVHRFDKQRPEMNQAENWGLFSPQAEANMQSVMGLQTYNSIRALDFLLSLPDVDATRIGVSGASGGGTQTFLLCAIDPRPTVAFPAVMVGTAMQGGCTCENSCGLRIGTGNVEFAAMFAPKPLGLTAADDWTREMSTKGFPELKAHYKLLGAPDNLMLKPLLHFGHNYNYVSRAALYGWFNKHLQLGQETPVLEGDYQRLSVEEMTVWDKAHPQPQGGPDFERRLLKQWKDDTNRQITAMLPQDAASLARWREVLGGGVSTLIGRSLPAASEVEYEQTHKSTVGNYLQMAGLVRNKTEHEEIPTLFLFPKEWNGKIVIWLEEQGKAGLFAQGTEPKPEISRLLAANVAVIGADLFSQGEFLPAGEAAAPNRTVKNPREFAGFTYGYNHALFAQRVHDVLTLVTFVSNHERKAKSVALVGLGVSTGPIAAAARALAGESIDQLAIDSHGFRFGGVTDYRAANFLPGGAKYGDLLGILSLSAPQRTWIAGEGAKTPELLRTPFAAAGSEQNLTLFSGNAEQIAASAVAWLMEPDK